MHKKSGLRCLTLVAAAVGALGLAASAQATPSLATGGYASTPNGGDNVSIVSPVVTRDILAGGFVGVQTDLISPPSTSTILFWCFELDQYFSPGTTYTDYTAITPYASTALAELFTEVFHGATISQPISDIVSAAVQLAVWEIRYENAPTYSLASGAFSASGGTGSVALAQTFLDHLGDPQNQPSSYVVSLLHSDSEQDFVTATPIPTGRCTDCGPDKIPEPPMLPLLGAGAAALLFARRHRLLAKQL